MVEILRFDEALLHRAQPLAAKRPQTDNVFSVWPEVSCGLCTQADPANAQGKVLFEILLILGAAAAIATAISLLTGAPYAM